MSDFADLKNTKLIFRKNDRSLNNEQNNERIKHKLKTERFDWNSFTQAHIPADLEKQSHHKLNRKTISLFYFNESASGSAIYAVRKIEWKKRRRRRWRKKTAVK